MIGKCQLKLIRLFRKLKQETLEEQRDNIEKFGHPGNDDTEVHELTSGLEVPLQVWDNLYRLVAF